MDPLSFFRTPTAVAEALFKAEKFSGEIWEPCCGDGSISEVAKAHGYKVYSSDLGDYGYGKPNVNFLGSWRPAVNIVSNPPFERCMDFVERALRLSSGKVALLLPPDLLTYKLPVFRERLVRMYPFGERIKFHSAPFRSNKGAWRDVAWYVFAPDIDSRRPTIHWL